MFTLWITRPSFGRSGFSKTTIACLIQGSEVETYFLMKHDSQLFSHWALVKRDCHKYDEAKARVGPPSKWGLVAGLPVEELSGLEDGRLLLSGPGELPLEPNY